ncbi:MAG: serine/threonine-protein kinase [Deltaproteobacteria bacterium]|nr:serine/threonine-protein kinase [Deltaproteobacteria bacterium]
MQDLSNMEDVTLPLLRSGSADDSTVVQRCRLEGTPALAVSDEGHVFHERFGRYLLQEKLGSGGMAEVWKAVAEGAQGFRRVFVVKRILPAFASSPYFVSLFADEAKLSAMLHHPNLVQVYEFGVVAGIHYLSMDYLDGMDLASVLTQLSRRGERMAPSTAAFVAQQIAHGLAYAHTACDSDGKPLHLVHRDVSPENVMLLDAGTVKLFDFGIALSDQRLASSVTQGKVLKGKLGYTSPEQVTGRPLDGRSDIFSLGVVMWEMLTCRRLFAGEDDARTLYNVLERPITPPSKIAPEVPKAFDAVVLRALARNPADRYPTADHLAEDLDEVLRVVSHHRTDIPRLLEHAFGRRPLGFALPSGASNGAQPVSELPSTETAETMAEVFDADLDLPAGVTESKATLLKADSQIFVPTQMWQRRGGWPAALLSRLPRPARAGAALFAALAFVLTLRALGTSNDTAQPVAQAEVAPALAPQTTAQIHTTPLSRSTLLDELRTRELTSLFEEGLRQPLAAPEPQVAKTANDEPLVAPREPPVVRRRSVALRDVERVRTKPHLDLWKHTGDVLDAAHVDPFSP